MKATKPAADLGRLRARLRRDLARRFFLRGHMSLILVGVALAGLAASKLLLFLGVASLPVRWLLAVGAAYLVFFVLVRLWVAYVAPASKRHDRAPELDLGLDTVSNGPGDVSASPSFRAGGGRFGGGGASGSFEGDASPGGSGGSSGVLSGLDLDDEGLVILLVLGLLVLLLFGVGAWVVYEAPTILGEAAFEALLASGLVRASLRLEAGNWTGSVFRATVIPFALVLAASGVVGWVVQAYCPGAARLAEVFRLCLVP